VCVCVCVCVCRRPPVNPETGFIFDSILAESVANGTFSQSQYPSTFIDMLRWGLCLTVSWLSHLQTAHCRKSQYTSTFTDTVAVLVYSTFTGTKSVP